MTRPKLTGIFPPDIKPVRPGVYSAFPRAELIKEPCVVYAFFDGYIWGCSRPTIGTAVAHPDFEFAAQDKYWRGLAEEPKQRGCCLSPTAT